VHFGKTHLYPIIFGIILQNSFGKPVVVKSAN
jgi:hypothetical protein